MSLRDIQIDSEYRTLSCDMANDFYIPMLGEAILYKRAVGFFSSSALAAISAGIYELYENGGKIQLIASPRLSPEDIEAINDGYQQREEIIKGALKRQLEDCTDFCQQNRLNLLATLIAKGILDIRIAVTIGKKGIGMYHEKMGLIEDIEGNIVAFSGSMNETDTAIHDNYEAIDVFCSWISTDNKRVERKNQAFTKMWDGLDENICVMKFPEIEKEFIEKYQMGDIDAKLLKEGWAAYHVNPTFGLVKPEWLNLYDYQQEAIKKWQANDYCGIFDMATGTGKTLTALGAVAELCKNVKRLAVIIVCPYQHLVEQWVEDIRAFGANPIIGYSGSSYTNYKRELKNRIFNFNYKITDFFCFITTNASFMSKAINEEIRKLTQDTILVVDEAHNFGAKNLQNTLQQDFTYRLALSATLERQGDEDGTNILRNFFGNKCIEYGLERAIAEKKLTPYYYYPVIVYLTDAELDKYQLYTSKIIQNIVKRKDKTIVTNLAKEFMLKRARLVAGASEKIEKLREMANDFKNEKNMLIYCGATNVQGHDNCSGDDIRQIDYISRMLNFDFGMRTAQFTSREDSKERKRRLEEFQNGEIQALIAIKCLDEGVNVPAIKTAYILASTTNPKEYIQRRGRVLRLYPGKEAAYIYDFITLPRELTTVENTSSELAKSERALVVKEIRRMREFCHIALNPYETQMLIMDLRDIYNVTEEKILEKDEGELLYELY